MVWDSHLSKNFPQFLVIHTVKGFGIVNKAEIDVFLELTCFFHDPADVGNLISGSSAFSKTSLNIRGSNFMLITISLVTDMGFIFLYSNNIVQLISFHSQFLTLYRSIDMGFFDLFTH